MRASAEAAATDKVIQGLKLPRARPHRVQEDVGILDDLKPRIDAPQLARIMHRPGEGRAELTMRRAPSDDPGAEGTRVVERNFDVRAARVGGVRLRTEQRLDLPALQKIQNAFGNYDCRSAGVPRQRGEELRVRNVAGNDSPAFSIGIEPSANLNYVWQIDIDPLETAVARRLQFLEACIEAAPEIDAQSVRVAFEKPAHRLPEPLRSQNDGSDFAGVEIKASRIDIKLAKDLTRSALVVLKIGGVGRGKHFRRKRNKHRGRNAGQIGDARSERHIGGKMRLAIDSIHGPIQGERLRIADTLGVSQESWEWIVGWHSASYVASRACSSRPVANQVATARFNSAGLLDISQ